MKSTTESDPSYRVGPYLVDGRAREVAREGTRISLTKTEFDVFYQIVQRKGGLIRREEIAPWTMETKPERHPVEMVIVELRKKLDRSMIETVPAHGYRLASPFTVERIPSPSATELEQLVSIALAKLNTHTSAGLQAAIQNCQELLHRGEFADAYSTMALAYLNLGQAGFCRELPSVSIEKARDVIRGAIRWFPKFASAYALRGLTYLLYDYNWSAAETDFRKALDMSPDNELAHSFFAHLLVAKGAFVEGLAHAERAAKLDYESPVSAVTEPWLMVFAGRFGEAVMRAERVVGRFNDSAPAHIILGHAYGAAGDAAKALEQYDCALQIDFLPEAVASRGFIHGQAGRRKDALACIDTLRAAKDAGTIAYVSSWYEALVCAGLGEGDRAVHALEKAFNERCDWLIHLAVEPRWQSLRSIRRFKDLVKRVGITDA